MKEPYLQVLISTYGADGIQRLASSNYPSVEGVEYIVSWQQASGEVPEEISSREDFKVYKTDSRGLSRNRNESLRKAGAPVVLIADDDLIYDSGALRKLMEYHQNNPEIGIVCAHITVGGKQLPTWSDEEFTLNPLPDGYYFVSCEMSVKREVLEKSGVVFNELMGVGAPVLGCGEEEIFGRSLLRKGVKGTCIPLLLANHPGLSSGERLSADPSYIMSRGALLRFVHPHDWILKIPLWTYYSCRGKSLSPFKAIKWLYKGAVYSKKMNLFN